MACDDRLPARFLAGILEGAARDRFEDHLVDCDDCWREVTEARSGRALAEGLREAAPAGMRDRIRLLSIAGEGRGGDHPRRQRHRRAAVGALALAIVAIAVGSGAVLAPRERDPASVAWVVSRASQTQDPAGPPSFTVQEVDGHPLLVITRSEGGAQVVLALGRAAFPMIAGSNRLELAGGEAWSATRRGLSVVCVNGPLPVLAVGAVTPERLVLLATAAQSDPLARRLLSVAPP